MPTAQHHVPRPVVANMRDADNNKDSTVSPGHPALYAALQDVLLNPAVPDPDGFGQSVICVLLFGRRQLSSVELRCVYAGARLLGQLYIHSDVKAIDARDTRKTSPERQYLSEEANVDPCADPRFGQKHARREKPRRRRPRHVKPPPILVKRSG